MCVCCLVVDLKPEAQERSSHIALGFAVDTGEREPALIEDGPRGKVELGPAE